MFHIDKDGCAESFWTWDVFRHGKGLPTQSIGNIFQNIFQERYAV